MKTIQWIIPGCRLNQRYQLIMRALYTPWPDSMSETEAREAFRRRARALEQIDESAPALQTEREEQ